MGKVLHNYVPSMERSPNACSGNKALKYAIFETAIANNFFTNSIDFCSVMVSFGNIPVNYNRYNWFYETDFKLNKELITHSIVFILDLFHLSKPANCHETNF